jgi:hypothetical protein
MKRTSLRWRAPLRARKPLRRIKPLQRTPSLAATDAQRAAVAGRPCIVCGVTHGVDPAHLVPRALGGCGDASCVTALCRICHRAYDEGGWTCCRTSSLRGGRSLHMPSGTSG